jgi:hypothetical protein
VYLDALVQLLDERVVWINLQDVLFLVESDITLQSRAQFDALFVGRVVHHVCDDDDRVVDQPQTDLDVLHDILQLLAYIANQRLELLRQRLDLPAGVVRLGRVLEVVACHIYYPGFFVLLVASEDGFVQRIVAQDNFVP